MADPALQSFLDAEEQSETSSIPRSRSVCCCGNPDCAYLSHHRTTVDALERDVHTAAKLGQALLVRHETYISEVENERRTTTSQIEMLEQDKQTLETKNASLIDENRALLNQLEAVNNGVADSDSRIATLQSTLLSAQQELQKLSHLAIRTERLEQQLADFEKEQATWQASLDVQEESKKAALRRQQRAERHLASLQEEVERIENDAKEEKERHVEVVARMERRHAVENELKSAAGRLKGAAASRASVGGEPGGPNVVSHFVKDILQDNANLQMGIVELRDMLQSSNDEVESLRSQMQEQEFPVEKMEVEKLPEEKPKSNLRSELQRASSSELHVHHHYHAPTATPKAQVPRRTRKKNRYSTQSLGHHTPSSGFGTPRSSISYGSPSSAATILKQTAVSIPQSMSSNKRWSTQSAYESYSPSGPSSPRSGTNRSSSIFDRSFSDVGLDSSRPGTPDTEDPGSPIVGPSQTKRASFGSFRTHSAPVVQRGGIVPSSHQYSLNAIIDASVEDLPSDDQQSAAHDPIPEEGENEWENESSPELDQASSVTSPTTDGLETPLVDHSLYQPKVRRATSHESMFSFSGPDIHTLKSRPSQLLKPAGGRSFTPQAVISDAQALGAGSRPAAMSRPSDNSKSILTGMATERKQPSRPSLGKKVGGWVFGRWGASPSQATVDVEPRTPARAVKSPSTASSDRPSSNNSQVTPKAPKVRSPGINQSGSIHGFFPSVTVPTPPVLRTFNEEALREGLGE